MAHRWYVPLAGGPTDIEDLRHDLLTGDLRVEDQDGTPCLCGPRLDACGDEEEAFRAARATMALLNDAFTAAVDRYEGVRADGGLWQLLPDGVLRRHYRLEARPVRMRMRAFGTLSSPGSSSAPEPTLAERMVKAADVQPYFGVALRLFASRPLTFPALFVAFETIKQAGDASRGARERGGERIVGKGRASDDEMLDFTETAHLHRHGQPSGSIKNGCRQISFEEARELVRRLLTRWAQELVP